MLAIELTGDTYVPSPAVETERGLTVRQRPSELPVASSARAGNWERRETTILGVRFDHITLAETVDVIDEMVESREPHYVVTPNVDFLVQARRDSELRKILLGSHLVLCDGTPLVWASRWLGNPLPERVAGSDLAPKVIGLAAKKGYRLFFLGATPEANTQAVANVRARYPNLEISHYSPPFRPLAEMDHDDIGARIRAARPDILFAAFGCPKGEKWMAMNYRALGVPVMISVGATIDFLAGRVKRAPMWMRRGGVEWIYRMSQEPRRLFRRYASDLGPFACGITAQWWRERRLRASAAPLNLHESSRIEERAV